MANKKLKWYHYTAKVIFITITLPVAPLLILIALSMGEHPLSIYKEMWNSNK